MNHNVKMAAVAATAALALTACGVDDDDDYCRTQYVPMFFSTVDGHYHYGSPKGKTVPADKVPSTARKVPGYKAPATPKPQPKPNPKPQRPTGPRMDKPSAPKAPAAPRVGGRR